MKALHGEIEKIAEMSAAQWARSEVADLGKFQGLFDYAGRAAQEVSRELDAEIESFLLRLPPELHCEFRKIQDMYAAEEGALQAALINLLRVAA